MIAIYIIYFVAVILLVLNWNKRGSAWGGLTLGIVIGFVITLFNDFSWQTILISGSVGAIIGSLLDLIPSKINDS